MNRRAENRKRKLFCGAWILAGALLLGALTGCGGEPAVTVLPGTSVESTVSPSETPSSATGTTEPSSETKTPVSTQGNTEPPSSSSGASTQTPTVVPVSGVTVAPEVLTLKVGDVLLTGDTLFQGSMGRTDFEGGSYAEIMASLGRLGRLSGDYHVLPGHMGASTLEQERKTNYYLREAMEG